MEAENSETMTVEAIEWPFLKSQRDHDHDASSPDGSADHYEIVVSNVDDGTDGLHHFSNDDTPGSDSNFETCLISNADLAALTSTPPSASDGIKMEPLKDHHHHHHQSERVEYDAVQYFSDAGLGGGDDVVMTDDQQKLIKVYQTAMENSDNKLITVYEIKPECDDDGNSLGGRDVLVEIVSSPEEHLLRGTATLSADGTLLIGSPDGNDLHTHLTIPASMAAAMGLTTTSLSQSGAHHFSSMSPPQQSATTTTTTTVAELRCTLCGFVSFSRDEIGAHCEEAHDLFLCQACNLVFKRRQSLQSHAKAKHGTTFTSAKSAKNNLGVNSRAAGGGRVTKKGNAATSSTATAGSINNSHQTKFFNPLLNSSIKNNSGRQIHHQQQQQQHQQNTLSQDIMLQLPTQPLQPSVLNRSGHLVSSQANDRNNFDLMPDIREILAKNKAVMPNLTSTATNVTYSGSTSMAPSRQKKVTAKGKRQQNHNWARTLSQGDQPLILDSRLSDPVTRNQFNSEFAKKITSHGIGAEMFGMSQDRLPSLRGTYRLEIKERVAENGDASGHGASPAGTTSNGETMYSYDIVDTGLPSEGCKVICGLCNFSNPRIENVLFHCEIDHKQYYCQNKRCQNGFSSWDTLMRHMKNVHRKEKQ